MFSLFAHMAFLSGGFLLGVLFILIWQKRRSQSTIASLTRIIFWSTQVSALIWVFISYGIAIYSTSVLGQVYTMAELSEPAIQTILGVSFLKVVENMWEHNDGGLFGHSKDKDKDRGGDE